MCECSECVSVRASVSVCYSYLTLRKVDLSLMTRDGCFLMNSCMKVV